jgi:hypothetical protein
MSDDGRPWTECPWCGLDVSLDVGTRTLHHQDPECDDFKAKLRAGSAELEEIVELLERPAS